MLKLLIDMNLSPDWAPALQERGWQAVHWSTVGDPRASDVDSGSWTVSDDLLTAAKRLREQCPDAIDVWTVRVGHHVIGSIGGGDPIPTFPSRLGKGPEKDAFQCS